MLNLKTIEKKYCLYFPNLPLFVCEKNEEFYNVKIFDAEIIIYDLLELNLIIDTIINSLNKKQTENSIDESNKNNVIMQNLNENNVKKIKKESFDNKKKSINSNKNFILESKSTKGKMKIKNLQYNKYVPNFSEDDNETRNNILIEYKESFSVNINNYCINNSISHPEYLFEKSNGVYICRAMFMNEKIESRYAYDINVAKEDACNLIWSFIKYKDEIKNS